LLWREGRTINLRNQLGTTKEVLEGADPSEARAAALQEILDDVPLPVRLEHLVRAIEEQAPGLIASVLLVEGDRLRLAAAPNLPDGYNRLVDGKPVGEGYGSCGTAAYRRETVIVSDIQNDVLWTNYRDVARRYGLGACWSTPIFDRSGNVAGTFALYYREPRRPRADELALIREFSLLAGIGIAQDRARREFQESEGGFRDLVDDLDAIVWEADAETRQVTYVSRRAEQLLGYPLERWRSEPGFWDSLIHPEDREATLRQYRQAMRDGRDYQSEYRVTAVDGRIIWLRDIVHVKEAGESRAKRLRGFMVNISRQREAEHERESLVQRLLTEQALFHEVVEQMPDAVVIVEAPSGRILLANSEAERLAGVRLNLLTTLDHYASFQMLRVGDQPYGLSEWPIYRAINHGEVVKGEEMLVVRPDGSRRAIIASAVPVRDGKGAIVAGVVAFSDMTARKHADLARRLLADAGSTLGNTLEPGGAVQGLASLAAVELADWCAVFLPEDDGALRCAALGLRDIGKAYLRPQLERLLPQPGGVPFHASSVLASGQSRLFTTVGPDAFEAGAVRPELMRISRELGAESAMTVPLTAHGKTLGVVVYGSARSDRRYDRDDLALAQELAHRAALALDNAKLYGEAQGAIRHREEFLSIAAHELKTPLAGLQLALETLVSHVGRPEIDVDAVRARVAAGQRQLTRLDRLIDDLLDVSTIRAGRMQLAAQSMDLVDAVRAVVARFSDELRAKSVDVLIHAPAPVRGRWDPARIEQVITNLLSNAIKYGARKPIHIVVQDTGRGALLRVEDQGMGITPAVAQRLFRPFERGVAPGHYGGLGLGLYITAQIVLAHGGSIAVEPPTREGATLTVELPREGPA
jgi:PAS domain S-box-containing protein